jgi:hypothetical protein
MFKVRLEVTADLREGETPRAFRFPLATQKCWDIFFSG